MDRRTFLLSTGMISAASLLPFSALSAINKPRFKMGLQLYTVNKDMLNDPVATLKAVKAMGYQDFEIFGFDPQKGTYYGYPAAEFKKILDDLELTVSSGHYGFSSYLQKSQDELKRFVDSCIEGAKALNSSYITWPWIAPEQRTMDNFKKMAHLLNIIGEQVTSAGLGFAYHNHGFEFDDHDGENGFDVILQGTNANLVKLQMDMYWVMHSANKTPAQLIAEQPGRYVMWHIKDMDKVSRDYTELGNGSIDYTKILPSPSESGLVYYYLEQGGNFASSPLESVATSADYFKKHLQTFL